MICIAVVKIWKVQKNLRQVVDYAEDNEKTDLSKFEDLGSVIDYAENGDKTEESLYISGINCDSKNASNEMIAIKNKFVKTDGILAWHAYQSFKEGEVTPDEAHKIGMELAKEMWGDRFQVVVTTHLNTKHLDNHFVINSVSFVDGKKYNADRNSYAEFRRLNDLICMEHGKSYLKENKTKSGINYINYQNRGIKYSNYYKKAKEDIDLAIATSNSYDEFKRILSNMGYDITVRAEKLSIRGKDYKRNIRIERYFGEDYSIENIKKQIMGLYLPEKQSYYRNYYQRDNTLDFLFKMNSKGLALSYLKCLKIMNEYPTYTRKCRLSNSIKEEVARMDSFSKETILLVTNHIETEEDLNKYYLSLGKESVEEKQLCKNILKRKDKVVEGIKEIEREVLIR